MNEYKIYFRGYYIKEKFTETIYADNPHEALDKFYQMYNSQCVIRKVKEVDSFRSLDVGYGFCLGIGTMMLLFILWFFITMTF